MGPGAHDSMPPPSHGFGGGRPSEGPDLRPGWAILSASIVAMAVGRDGRRHANGMTSAHPGHTEGQPAADQSAGQPEDQTGGGHRKTVDYPDLRVGDCVRDMESEENYDLEVVRQHRRGRWDVHVGSAAVAGSETGGSAGERGSPTLREVRGCAGGRLVARVVQRLTDQDRLARGPIRGVHCRWRVRRLHWVGAGHRSLTARLVGQPLTPMVRDLKDLDCAKRGRSGLLHQGGVDRLGGASGRDNLGESGGDANFGGPGSDLCRSPQRGPRAPSCER